VAWRDQSSAYLPPWGWGCQLGVGWVSVEVGLSDRATVSLARPPGAPRHPVPAHLRQQLLVGAGLGHHAAVKDHDL
jgi:hypothetical protein